MTKRAEATIEKYGVMVVADIEIEAMRSAGCLCLRCVRMVTEDDVAALVVDGSSEHVARLTRAFNCPTAQRLYDACVDGDVATPITRCPLYLEKTE